MTQLKIYCITNIQSEKLEKLGLNLVGVGKNSFNSKYITCEEGDNINSKEKNYSELTFHYWFWKNKIKEFSDDDWIGFCQRRRFWLNSRNENLNNELEKFLKKKSAVKWEEELIEIGVPSGTVMSIPEILAHPQIKHRELLAKFENLQSIDRNISVMRTGFLNNGKPSKVDTPPPTIGEHNDELLTELGYDDNEISKLKKDNII